MSHLFKPTIFSEEQKTSVTLSGKCNKCSKVETHECYSYKNWKDNNCVDLTVSSEKGSVTCHYCSKMQVHKCDYDIEDIM